MRLQYKLQQVRVCAKQRRQYLAAQVVALVQQVGVFPQPDAFLALHVGAVGREAVLEPGTLFFQEPPLPLRLTRDIRITQVAHKVRRH